MKSSDNSIDADVSIDNRTLSDGMESTVLPVLGIKDRIVEQNNEKENIEAVAACFC